MFAKEKNNSNEKVFTEALILIIAGFLLPIVIGFLTALPELSHPFFIKIVFSNSAISLIFCLPISLAVMALSIVIYKRRLA